MPIFLISCLIFSYFLSDFLFRSVFDILFQFLSGFLFNLHLWNFTPINKISKFIPIYIQALFFVFCSSFRCFSLILILTFVSAFLPNLSLIFFQAFIKNFKFSLQFSFRFSLRYYFKYLFRLSMRIYSRFFSFDIRFRNLLTFHFL